MALQTEEFSIGEFAPIGPFFWRVGTYKVERLWCIGKLGESRPEQADVLKIENDPSGNRAYAPLGRGDLFTEFGSVSTGEDVQGFASKYGHLGIQSYLCVKRSPIVNRGTQTTETAELINDWLAEASSMKWCVDLWDRLSNDRLGGVISWTPQAVLYNDPDGNGCRVIADSNHEFPRFYHSWKRGDLRGPASLALSKEINSHLRKHLSLQLVCAETSDFQLYTRPFNLLGALWYQMALAFVGKASVKRCADCDGFMVVRRKTKTMHESCAAARRQRIYREKQNVKTKPRKR